MRPVMMAAKKKGAAAGGGGGGSGGGGGTITYAPAAGIYDGNPGSTDQTETFTITASASVVWNWSAMGSVPSATVANGGSGTTITFTLHATLNDKACTITCTSGGHTWTINMSVAGTGTGTQ